MARYKATREGLVGTAYINPGEEFELPDDAKAPTWAEPLDGGRKPASKKKNDNQGEG